MSQHDFFLLYLFLNIAYWFIDRCLGQR